jgi:hypothetical protein
MHPRCESASSTAWTRDTWVGCIRCGVGPVPDVVLHRLVTPDGVSRVYCGPACTDCWLGAVGTDASDLSFCPEPVRIQNSCAACSWCGETVAVPASGCRMHSDGCPDFDVMFTLHAQRAVVLLRRRTQGDVPSPAFDCLSRAARALRDSGVEVDAGLLADRVWDVRADWME